MLRIIEETLLDMTSVELSLDASLDIRHARWLRGAIGNRSARHEFHQHGEDGLIYKHPLIRYDTSNGNAWISGLKEGAFLLKAFAAPDHLRLGDEQLPVIGKNLNSRRVAIGISETKIEYEFVSPYLPLNQVNNRKYRNSTQDSQKQMIAPILCGNILSFCKSVGHHVNQRIVVDCDLHPTKTFTLKPGVRLLGFAGRFSVNFRLPDHWGLGKSSGRGFGTIVRRTKNG